MADIKRIEDDTIFVGQEISYAREIVDDQCKNLPQDIIDMREQHQRQIQQLRTELNYFRVLQQAFRGAEKQEK